MIPVNVNMFVSKKHFMSQPISNKCNFYMCLNISKSKEINSLFYLAIKFNRKYLVSNVSLNILLLQIENSNLGLN